MRKLLICLFGERANNVRIINRDGRQWAVGKDVCDILGIKNVSQVLKPDTRRNDMTHEDSRKYPAEEVRWREIWYISEAGLWKLVGRAKRGWALLFRQWAFTGIIPEVVNTRRNAGTLLLPEFPVGRQAA